MSVRRRLGPVDAIWLNMDRPNNLMVIVGLMLLEGTPDWDRVTEIVRTRLVDRYPVFRQRPVAGRTPWSQPAWEDDPDFALERHIRRVKLESPGDDEALRHHVDAHLHRAFDREHPLWEAELVEGFGEGSAVVWRFHHALADGIALTQVLMSMTDADPEGSDGIPAGSDGVPAGSEGIPARSHGVPAGDGEPGAEAADTRAPRAPLRVVRPSHLAQEVVTSAGSAVGTTLVLGRRGIAGLVEARHLLRPGTAVKALTFAGRTGRVIGTLTFSHTPDSPLGGTPWTRKHVAWSHPFPLSRLKKVGRLADATLNDVLMSAVAGAMYRYQAQHGADPVDLVTMVPVNVRPPGVPLPRELGNRFALVFFTFPSSVSAPLARLAETKRRMDWVKESPEVALTFSLIAAIGRTTVGLERHLVNFFANKAIGVTTNVMGPTSTRYFAGSEITGLLGWVPGSGTHTVGVCIFTYADTLRVGFMVDAESVPDPSALVEAFEREVDDLVGLVSTT